ncbi:hypothetical protein Mth01_00290 [Sphaerimonospora thailandensis]|uniref:Uncharacterized protein n=2 Tax=Sphaerimonospora thailandensis TaxID=795644 RepID=A0A8J3R4N7_9ACTN|nr:hypothetical protein Mth01_00290 [Sphaerimonospora thailandensis]
MALLPERWRKDLIRAAGEIVIRVNAGDETSARIRAEVMEILTNPEVGHWQLVACGLVADGHPEPKEADR